MNINETRKRNDGRIFLCFPTPTVCWSISRIWLWNQRSCQKTGFVAMVLLLSQIVEAWYEYSTLFSSPFEDFPRSPINSRESAKNLRAETTRIYGYTFRNHIYMFVERRVLTRGKNWLEGTHVEPLREPTWFWTLREPRLQGAWNLKLKLKSKMMQKQRGVTETEIIRRFLSHFCIVL